jgi:hypothetical protein
LWSANTLIPQLPKSVIETARLKWCDIPHERDARIASKRAAENLHGASAVDQYIQGKIAERVTPSDAEDWECIARLVTSTEYDLARETSLFFRRMKDYRLDFERVLERFTDDSDFLEIRLDRLFDGGPI